MIRFSSLVIASAIVLAACGTPAPTASPAPPPPATPIPAPTGTPVPTEAPMLAPRLNITCSNTLSDADLINTAINRSLVGAELVIGGPCLINQTIRLLGDRAYRGESRTGTVLKQADGANLAALLASDSFLDNTAHTGRPVSVRHLTLEGNRRSNTGAETAGIILRSWLSVVEDVHIADMAGDGLRLTNESANGTRLENSQVNGRISGNFIENSGRHGLSVADPENRISDWLLSENWIGGSGLDGIHLDNAAGWIVERNHVYNVSQNAIYAHRMFATSISDNYIEKFGRATQAATWYGINATLQGGAASTITGNRVFNFEGEHNQASSYRYIALSVNYGTGVVSVTGNTIRGANTTGEVGLYYTAGENMRLIVTSTGNAVENVDTKRFLDSRVTLSPGF